MSIEAVDVTVELADESATLALGRRLAGALQAPSILIELNGELGAGKTTLVRGLLRGLGYAENVVSPTYTLMEVYCAGGLEIVHLDLYRINDPEELEFLGLRDRFASSVVLVEWPQRGAAWLPPADLQVHLRLQGVGRTAVLRALSQNGRALIARLGAL